MTEQVFRVIYMSECVLPSGNPDYADAIDQLLKVSRAWNDDHELTGALLFSSGYFAQVLEGPEHEVRQIIGQIVCDPRHQGLRLIERGMVPARVFGNWSMAYTDGEGQLDLSMMDVIGMPNESQGAAILRMLRHIVTPDKPFAGGPTGQSGEVS